MNKIELLGGTLAGMMFLSGCAPVTEASKSPIVEIATLPNGTATVTATTEALVTPTDVVTVTEAIENIEGVSTQEQIQSNIKDYLSGKVDYSVTGPNKDYLFTDLNKKPLPLSTLTIGKVANEFSTCLQQGVYMGSFITGSDERVISMFGTQRTKDSTPVIEFFTTGFLNIPSDSPMNFVVSYASVGEKSPLLQTAVIDTITGSDLLKKMSGKENEMEAFNYICYQNSEGVNSFISSNTVGDPAKQKMLEWGFAASEDNGKLLDWLQGSSNVEPGNVILNKDTVDFSKINWSEVPILDYTVIPTDIAQ